MLNVLRTAGFDVPAGRRGRGFSTGAGRQRAKAVSVEEIKNYVLVESGTFLLADVMAGVGGSQATVRKAIDELIDAGQIEKLSPSRLHRAEGEHRPGTTGPDPPRPSGSSGAS